jgi:hypothetical protein
LVWNVNELSDPGDWDEQPPDDDEEWDPRVSSATRWSASRLLVLA